MLRKLAVVMVAASAFTACAHKAQVAAAPPAPPPSPVAVAPAVAPPPAHPLKVSCTEDLQCTSDQLCVEGSCTAITPALAACGPVRVHFDFDQAIIHPDEYGVLQRATRCIQANQPAHVLITGNADERGTVEYNLALGQRRAAEVRRYLESMGVADRRLELVTYGKEIPLCAQHDEACWRRNRRAGVRPGETPQDITAKVTLDERRERTASK
jgi:peptidoglycan-associated lipoprotein